MPMIDSHRTNSGFTLVEIAMVMIIIGLLIGGFFGGMKLRENAQIMDIIKQLTLYEASAIKFKELYGDLPGDIMNPSARLNNCNTAPCNRAGNGDGVLAGTQGFNSGTAATTVGIGEPFVFWNHLLNAGLISGIRGADDFTFGQGQPGFDIGGGVIVHGSWWASPGLRLAVSRLPNPQASPDYPFLPCGIIENIDIKLDDGLPFNIGGKVFLDTYMDCWDRVFPQTINKRYMPVTPTRTTGSFIYKTRITQ